MTPTFSQTLDHGRFETWTVDPGFFRHQVTQVHGTSVAPLRSLPCEADGLVASWTELNQPLAIKTADCLPVVIEGKDGVVFLHAGWRGLSAGILRDPSLDQISPLGAFIGPSIQGCCFEVSEDFSAHFPASSFFTRQGGKLHFDLQKQARHDLQAAFPGLSVAIASACTCCDPGYHSHRRDKTSNRNVNLYIKG